MTNLKPFKLYEFDVKAHTDNAEGPYSSVVQCSTLEGREFFLFVTICEVLKKKCEQTSEYGVVIIGFACSHSLYLGAHRG